MVTEVSPPWIFLHAGLPRTATTVLQTHVFPACKAVRYVGKHPDNRGLGGVLNDAYFDQLCLKILAGDRESLELLRRALPTLLHAVKTAARDKDAVRVRDLAARWTHAVTTAAVLLEDVPILYSDESLSESMSGVVANLDHGDTTALEALHESGLLRRVSLSLVLREPLSFLKASYYKTQEFMLMYKREPISFDEYIRRQLVILERHRPGSRIFLCLHNEVTAYFRRLARRTVILPYERLLASDNVVDTLLGIHSSDKPVRLADLPRENRSWRNPQINGLTLSAPGVRPGISIEDYVSTFPETLHRFGVDQLISEDRARAAQSQASQSSP